ncbi:MAG TPA: hypothetical protein VNN77_03750 [candidate division Zixibacteria bacterium]|nr:hypothetical protein [candidate division Zixibacteria bacterium]
MLKRNTIAAVLAALILILPFAGSGALGAQSELQEDDGAFYFGSIILSILHFPLKLATCVGTQATGAVAYVATYDVHGHYDGGTYGRDIGETARRSCTGAWLITPTQVKRDYGE